MSPDPTLASASQFVAPPAAPVSVTVSGVPGVAVVALTVSTAGLGGGGAAVVTVTTGLVAASVKPPFANKRNSYWPGVLGIATVQSNVVRPPGTYVNCT